MKKAFTLAEVLITLGIIGIVAAMTIPTLMQRYTEKKTVSVLRETQSILAQALKMSAEENGDADGWGLEHKMSSADAKAIADKLLPYMKIAVDCGVMDDNGICAPNKLYKRLDGGNWQTYYDRTEYYKVKLLNGSSIWWRSAHVGEVDTNGSTQFVVFIDTNGPTMPNTWGKDLFAFYVYSNSVKPMGDPYDMYKNTCNKKDTGIGCAYYVLSQNNMNYLH